MYEVISTMRKGHDVKYCTVIVDAPNKLVATIKGAHRAEERYPGYEANMTNATKMEETE